MELSMCKKICGECPFSETSMAGWLGPHSVQEILDAQQFEQIFTCHKTRDQDDILPSEIGTKKNPVCRGFVASASASCKLFGQNPETGEQLRKLQNEITQFDMNTVLDRRKFEAHHDIF